MQGDAPDGCEPVVALPPNEDLSSSSSDDFGNDVEEGPGEAGESLCVNRSSTAGKKMCLCPQLSVRVQHKLSAVESVLSR